MTVKYRITESDFMTAYEAFWRSRNLGGKTELVSAIMAISGGLLLLWLDNSLGWLLVSSGAALGAVVPLRQFLHRRAYRENRAYSGDTTVRFSDDQIDVSNPIGESDLNWSFYQSALESDDFFMPMISKRSFSIIPKRVFASEEEMDSFRSLLESKLGAIKKI